MKTSIKKDFFFRKQTLYNSLVDSLSVTNNKLRTGHTIPLILFKATGEVITEQY